MHKVQHETDLVEHKDKVCLRQEFIGAYRSEKLERIFDPVGLRVLFQVLGKFVRLSAGRSRIAAAWHRGPDRMH